MRRYLNKMRLLFLPLWMHKELEIGNASFQIRYQISGDNQLKAMWVQRDNITLAEISAVSDGVLTIELQEML